MRNPNSGFSHGDKARLLLAVLSVIPLVAVLFMGAGKSSPQIVALVTSIGIVAAGYSLAWGTESLQFVVSQVLALALLAVLQVLPEYSIEANLSYRGAFDPTILNYATASLTGANRLLLGLGWPSVVAISYLSSRRRGESSHSVDLDSNQSPSIFFLIISALYSLVIVAKASLTIADAGVMAAIYGGYVYVARKAPPLDMNGMVGAGGPAGAISRLPKSRRYISIVGLLILGGFMIFVGSGPFVESLLELGRSFNVSEYLLIQWLAPFLTEFPEGITAAYWAARTRLAPVALANLISSKVNQWTLLLGTIPVVYTVALGRFQPILLSGLQVNEILITAAQSLYGTVCLLDMRLEVKEGGLLLGLFLLQFFIPPSRLVVTVAYFLLTAFVLARTSNRTTLFSSVWRMTRGRSGRTNSV